MNGGGDEEDSLDGVGGEDFACRGVDCFHRGGTVRGSRFEVRGSRLGDEIMC